MYRMLTDDLLNVARIFCYLTNRTLSTTSKLAANEGKFLPRIEKGERQVTTRRYERTMHWFSDNWPSGHTWPKGIQRPGGRANAD